MRNAEKAKKALKLRKQGLAYNAIGKKIGVATSTARKWCNPDKAEHFRAQARKSAEKGKEKRRIKIKEYNQRPEVKERINRLSKEKKIKKFIEKGYNVHPDGYLLGIKCDHCGEAFSTKNRGPMAALRIYPKMYCTNECRIKLQIKKSVAVKREKQGGLRKFNCPHCGDKIETYREHLKLCGKIECERAESRVKQGKTRGEWVEVKKECRNCKKPFTAKVRECTPGGHAQDPIEATQHIKYCSRKCGKNYRGNHLTDPYVKTSIKRDFSRSNDMIISDDQISPQMVEDKRLLLKLNRAWKTKTGKHHSSRYQGRWEA